MCRVYIAVNTAEDRSLLKQHLRAHELSLLGEGELEQLFWVEVESYNQEYRSLVGLGTYKCINGELDVVIDLYGPDNRDIGWSLGMLERERIARRADATRWLCLLRDLLPLFPKGVGIMWDVSIDTYIPPIQTLSTRQLTVDTLLKMKRHTWYVFV